MLVFMAAPLYLLPRLFSLTSTTIRVQPNGNLKRALPFHGSFNLCSIQVENEFD